ncbi:MAG: hypothetical protein J0I77_19430 [Rudaea sp.]|uniref:hypothetical protein n=1 Tax=unclassified Rudaea TaxID=2627037 RepID=UPI0010F5B017|nr:MULTISPECIES: hypothetical protein [unclassified Rudaea]MBN8887906.1 hypothetical protein [Rudaea sp.]MBR0344137.1 hypothetical protein [Rudaea sp.]
MKHNKIEKLLSRLCAELGFCLTPEQKEHMTSLFPHSVEAFTDAVFVAEGLDPKLADRHLWRQVRDHVSQCFREVKVDA